MKILTTMTLNECAAYLRKHGLGISNVTLANGIEQGAFPFGVCIREPDGETRTFKVFRRLVDEWIAEREVDA